jgi:hypothetical protein
MIEVAVREKIEKLIHSALAEYSRHPRFSVERY